jgi:antitoxin component HigA of HigAB toxin-antitoxin module
MDTLHDVFQKKYDEFARDLQGACPELAEKIAAAVALNPEQRRLRFKAEVLGSCSPSRAQDTAPACVLPGVPMPQAVWEVLSTRSKKAIQEYMTILSFSFLLDADFEGGSKPPEWTADFATKMMHDMKEKMKGLDFGDLAEKISKMFGSAAEGGGIPSLPEKFMKGQIAKLAEEIVKEFNLEDLGIDPKVMEAAGNDPTKALQIIMDVFMKNPVAIQNTMKKLAKKLGAKIQSGALRPQELVAEAEELMKTFSENPQFVSMMESFRQSFGAAEEDLEKATGSANESSRLSIVRQRLQKKLAAKKAAAGKKQ